MSRRRPVGTLESMTGDFLPRRRQASTRTQAVAATVLLAVAAVATYLLLNR